jgi:hypothetical protein
MAIQDSDRFLIDDAGTSKKIRADKLKGGLDSTYANMKLLVNKADYSSRWVYCKDLQTNLPDDHWMLVERSGVSYKVSGSEVQNYFPSGPAGATGVITDSHTTPITNGSTGTHDLTVASLATPNFADNESIRMVDSNGDTASYVPVTSTIESVGLIPAPTSITYKVYKPTYTDCRTLAYTDGTDEQTLAPGIRPTIDGTFHAYFYKFDVDQIANIKEGDPNILYFSFWYSDTGAANTWTFDRIDDSKSDGKTAFATKAAKYWIILRVPMNTSTPWRPSNDAMVSNKYAVVDNPPGALLAFADPCPDLKFFQPGDVVQGTPTYPFQTDDLENNVAGKPVSDPKQAYNGDLTDGCLGGQDTTWLRWNLGSYNLNVSAGDVVRVYLRNQYVQSANNIGTTNLKFTDSSNLSLSGATGTSPVEYVEYNITSDKTILYIETYTTQPSQRQPAISGLAINGVVLIGDEFADQAGQVKVISRDPAARTMVVDGGAWTGDDGTNSGDAADRETEVTGPSKSGTAKCDGVPANTTFSIKDSNGEWIDNTNRLGENFYVKNGTGRVSIQRLLEVAIAEATTWAAETGYAEGSFVEHNGEYWYALSSSYGNSPDDNDSFDWLRLS